MITVELLARLLAIAVELGELHFPPETSAKICDRLLELVCTVDHQELCVLSNEPLANSCRRRRGTGAACARLDPLIFPVIPAAVRSGFLRSAGSRRLGLHVFPAAGAIIAKALGSVQRGQRIRF